MLCNLALIENEGMMTGLNVLRLFSNSFFQHQKDVLENNVNTNQTVRRRSTTYEIARLWFEKFIRFADSMPNSDVKSLPSCLTKMTVYQLYRDQMKHQKTLSRTQFTYDLWKKKYPNVHIPRVS